MLSRIPKVALTLAGLALPLSLSVNMPDATKLGRDAVRIGVSNAIASQLPPDAATFSGEEGVDSANGVEYSRNGSQRILRATGTDLDTLHSVASNEFLRHIEEEIKTPGAALIISDFKTDVSFEDGKFIFEYSVNLLLAENSTLAHTLVAMRGTVWCGNEAKAHALALNAEKIPAWRQRMSAAYPGTEIDYELAQSEKTSAAGPIFHEAVLAKGNVRP